MPLGPLPASTTGRGLIHYTSGGIEHTFEFRLGLTAVKADFESKAQTLADLFGPLMTTTDSAFSADFIPLGSNISQPMALTPVAGTAASGTPTDQTNSSFLGFSGRSVDGRRVTYHLFYQNAHNQVQTRTSVATGGVAVQALFDELSGASPPATTISGETPSLNAYANWGRNAYWQRNLR